MTSKKRPNLAIVIVHRRWVRTMLYESEGQSKHYQNQITDLFPSPCTCLSQVSTMSDNSHSILRTSQRRPLRPASPLLLVSHPKIQPISKSHHISLCWNPSHGHTYSFQTGLPACILWSLWSTANTVAREALGPKCQEAAALRKAFSWLPISTRRKVKCLQQSTRS